MKKYRIKLEGSGDIFGEFSSRKEASIKLMEFINDVNKDLNVNYISPFDFVLEEVECKEVNEVITDFESAKRYLNQKKGLRPHTLSIRSKSEDAMRQKFFEDINERHLEALIALNQLFTIAEAWNKEDGFVPDFSDRSQAKWFPWFTYDKDAAGFVSAYSANAPAIADANFGSRLCFKTYERAEQFVKLFSYLYNKVFLS